jgi:transcriptional/translational regulatory protein YebC/TACO1
LRFSWSFRLVRPLAKVARTDAKKLKHHAFTRRKSSVQIASSPSFLFQSDAKIEAKAEDDEDEELHNSHEPDLTWQEMMDLSPEDEIEGGPEIYYFTDEEHPLARVPCRGTYSRRK